MKILFSPIGQSDPICGLYDGPFLHICRYEKPEKCILFLSKEMAFREKDNQMYTEALRLLNEQLISEKKISVPIVCERIIESKDDDVVRFDTFFDVFETQIRDIHNTWPDAVIYLNASSGTPAMKSCLEVLFHYLPYKMVLCQTKNNEDNARHDNTSNNRSKVERGMNVMDAWETDLDRVEEKNRLIKYENNLKTQIGIRLQLSNIRQLITNYDFQAALDLLREGEFLQTLPQGDKLLHGIKGARYRIQLDPIAANRELCKIGFLTLDSYIKDESDAKLLPIAEMLLSMEIDISRHEYGSMLRKFTPVLYGITKAIISSERNVDPDDWLDNDGLLDKIKIEQQFPQYANVLLYNPNNNFLSTEIMYRLIVSQDTKNQVRLLRTKVEQTVRNKAAHDLVAVGEEWIKRKTGLSPEEIMKNLWALVDKLDENHVFNKEYRNSYADMSKAIVELMN